MTDSSQDPNEVSLDTYLFNLITVRCRIVANNDNKLYFSRRKSVMLDVKEEVLRIIDESISREQGRGIEDL